MLKGVAADHLLYTAGLYALLSLIPLILVYLIRPKPKKETVPALMFLMKETAKSDKRSFLRRIVRDPLFLFQLLLLISFAIAIAKPYMTTTEDVFVEKTAIVVDGSASSQVSIGGTTRFERAIEAAKSELGTKNAVIVMSSVPELIIDDADSAKAKDELDRIKPRDTPTGIFDSIIFAGNYVKNNDKVVVISDFIETASEKDYTAAKKILESKGIIVKLVNLRQSEGRLAQNIGIVDIDVGETETAVQVKNYNAENETVSLDLEGANLTTKQALIDAKGVEVINFPTPAGVSKFSIKPSGGHDDFSLDNDAYISSQSMDSILLLLISNKVTKYMTTALSVVPGITVETGAPPKVPNIYHQIIIISNINKDLVLPGTMKSIKKKVEEGAMLIVVAQPDLFSADFEGMLPVERTTNSGPVMIEHDVYITSTQESTLTDDINFGRVTRYLKVKPKDGAITIAETTNNVSMVVLKSYEKGTVIYFGMMDDYSTFKEDIFYPVFWKRLFDVAIKKQDLSSLNFRTGKLLNLLKEQKVTAPFGKVTTDTLLLTRQGIYRTEELAFAANLLSEQESNVNGEEAGEKIGVFEDESKKLETVNFELTTYFIIGLLVLVFLELLWIKFRGDL
jgi:hypothetical protein